MRVTSRTVVLSLLAVFAAGLWLGTATTPTQVPYVPVPIAPGLCAGH